MVAVAASLSFLVADSFLTPVRVLADAVVVIEGRGFGHGVGMAQDGAYWMGLSGRTSTEILRLFFPGTTLVKKGGTIRVPLGSGATLSIGFPSGGSLSGTKIPAGRTVSIVVRGSELVATVSPNATTPTSTEKRGVGVGAGASSIEAPAAFPLAANTDPSGPMASGGRSFSSAVSFGPSGVSFGPSAVSFGPSGVSFGAVVRTQGPGDPPIIPLTTTTTTEATTTTVASTVPASAPPAGEPSTSTSIAMDLSDQSPRPTNGVGEPGGEGRPSEKGTKSGSNSNSDIAVSTTNPGVVVQGSSLVADSNATLLYGGRRYRGTFDLRLAGGAARVVNVLDVEDYLRGMGEILTPSWPAATLQAQAIAARTYALRYMATSGEICPTQRCQVYLGAQAEYPAMDKAVAATRGKVIAYKGKLIAAFYSASGGGTIATPAEAFGGDTDVPYLQAGAYPTGDLKSWIVTMPLSEVARRVGYRGSPSGIAITDVGPSGRALIVSIYGTAGTLKVRGPAFDSALGLKSTFFTFGSGPPSGSGADAPAEPGSVLGPVGPRIPSVPTTDAGLPADGSLPSSDSLSAEDLFAQAEQLTISDPELDALDTAADTAGAETELATSDTSDATTQSATQSASQSSSDPTPASVAVAAQDAERRNTDIPSRRTSESALPTSHESTNRMVLYASAGGLAAVLAAVAGGSIFRRRRKHQG